jgi:hypothetical protein
LSAPHFSYFMLPYFLKNSPAASILVLNFTKFSPAAGINTYIFLYNTL